MDIRQYNHLAASDRFFKNLLDCKSEASIDFTKSIIREVTGINPVTVVVKNPEMPKMAEMMKTIIMDVLVEDEHGNLYDIEMQRTELDLELYSRIEHYGMRTQSANLREGEDYRKARHTLQIIFVDGASRKGQFITHYTMRDKEGDMMYDDPKLHIYLIHMPYVVTLNKAFEERTLLEKIVTFFKTGINDVIMKSEVKEVSYMVDRFGRFTNSEEEMWEAELTYRAELTKKVQMQVKYEEGMALGKEVGKKEGQLEEKKRTVHMMLDNGFDEAMIIKVLNITQDELDELK